MPEPLLRAILVMVVTAAGLSHAGMTVVFGYVFSYDAQRRRRAPALSLRIPAAECRTRSAMPPSVEWSDRRPPRRVCNSARCKDRHRSRRRRGAGPWRPQRPGEVHWWNRRGPARRRHAERRVRLLRLDGRRCRQEQPDQEWPGRIGDGRGGPRCRWHRHVDAVGPMGESLQYFSGLTAEALSGLFTPTVRNPCK